MPPSRTCIRSARFLCSWKSQSGPTLLRICWRVGRRAVACIKQPASLASDYVMAFVIAVTVEK